MNQRHSWVLGLAQWALRGLALLFLLGGAAGVLGASGTKSIYDRHVPRQFAEQVRRLWPQSGEMPTSWVKVRPPHYGDTYAQFNGIPDGGGTAPAGFAQLRDLATQTVGGGGELVFFDPGLLRRIVWLVAITLVPLALTWLWWTLSRMVGTARDGDPFTLANARRLAIAGVVVGLVPLIALLTQQLVLRWMLASSSAAGKADIWYRGGMLPLGTLGAGLALLVLAAIWRRGVAMRRDLEGLV